METNEIVVLIDDSKLKGVPDPKRYMTEEFAKAGIPATYDDRDILVADGKLAFVGLMHLYKWTSGDSKQSA